MLWTWIDQFLHFLVHRNDVDRAREALAMPDRVTATTTISRLSLLHIAAQNGNPAMAEMLLDMGANVNHTITSQGFTPLHLAMTEGYVTYVSREYVWYRVPGPRPASVIGDHVGVARLLLQRGAAVDQPTLIDPNVKLQVEHGGNTALCFACLHGNAKLISLLLEYGANAAYIKPNGLTPLYFSIWEVPEASNLILLQPGVTDQLLTSSQDGRTILMTAAGAGNCSLMRRIIGLDHESLHEKTNRGNTALNFALWNNQVEAVKLLLELGADPNATNNQGDTPLENSVRKGDYETTKILLEHGADPNARLMLDNKGMYPLTVACVYYRFNLVPLLLQHGAASSINNRDDGGNTALYYAAAYNQLETAKILISAGANVNIAQEDGITPLHQAAWRGFSKMVKLLIRSGANMGLKTLSGKTPIMYMLPLMTNGIPEQPKPRGNKLPENIHEPTEKFNLFWTICPSLPQAIPQEIIRIPTRKDVTKILRCFIEHGVEKFAAPEGTLRIFVSNGYPIVRWIEEYKVLHSVKRQAAPAIARHLRHAYYRPELNGIPGGPGYFRAITDNREYEK